MKNEKIDLQLWPLFYTGWICREGTRSYNALCRTCATVQTEILVGDLPQMPKGSKVYVVLTIWLVTINDNTGIKLLLHDQIFFDKFHISNVF